MLLCSVQRKVNIWALVRGRDESSISRTVAGVSESHEREISCLVMSTDGRTGVTGIRVFFHLAFWFIAYFKIVQRPRKLVMIVHCKYRSFLCKGSRDSTVRLWDLETCRVSQVFVGHTAPVTCVAMATDDAFVASGCDDKTVKIWSLMLGCVVTDYAEHGSGISTVFVLPDNYSIISMEKLGKARLWSAENGVTTWCVAVQSGIAAMATSGLMVACASTLGTK
jgi:WD40 repeat protein